MKPQPNLQIMLTFPSLQIAKDWVNEHAIVNWTIQIAGQRVYLTAPPVIDKEDWIAIGKAIAVRK